MKKDFIAIIKERKRVSDNAYELSLAVRGLSFACGQFFMLSIPEHSLRRAFAPSASDDDGFTFTCAIVGAATEKLCSLPIESKVNILAPLGNGYDLTKINSATTALLIGGGCGAPSLVMLARDLRQRGAKVYTILGARTQSNLLSTEALQKNSDEFMIATDDGSCGFHGNAVTVAHELSAKFNNNKIVVFACGPTPMLKAISEWTNDKNIPCQISLEERMGCGFGACMGCVVKIKTAENTDGFTYQRVCHEGPVFNAQDVIFS